MSNKNEEINQKSDLNTLVEGWQFRIVEISANYYRVEGNDRQGRSVSRTGSEVELDQTLQACVNDARDIQKQIQEK